MNPQEPPEDFQTQDNGGRAEPADNSLANKLSEELSNWRRRRHIGGPRSKPADGARGGDNFTSEPARTIKVRGHETLVIRKPKSAIKSPSNPPSTNQ